MSSKKKDKSLYEQVIDILNVLQGNKIPSYQGLNAFWLNPEIFLSASLYGQRLIAPKTNRETQNISSCCGTTEKKTTSLIASSPTNSSGCCKSSSKDSLSISSQNNSQSAITQLQQPIVPVVNGDCWPSGGSSGGGGSIVYPKRSEQSAIITGLKGLYPFDGSIFPRLLWDTNNVATPQQIQVIANWIDADCPLEDNNNQENTFRLQEVSKTNRLLSLASGEMLHTASTDTTNIDTTGVKGLTVRKEISSLTTEELGLFREAINCMNQYNNFWQDERSFDYWARIHTNSCQHGWEQFVPWHRLYLYFFEQKLQDYNKNISLPYWSWTDYADANTNTFNNSQYDLGILPEAYGCFLTPNGLNKLKNVKSTTGATLFSAKEITGLEKISSKGTVYNSGLRFLKAAGINYEIVNNNGTAIWSEKITAIYTVLKEINPLWFSNRWPGALTGTASVSQYPTKDDIELLLKIDNFGDFGGGSSYDHHYGALEKVHNGMHNFSGGTNPCYPDNSPEWKKTYEKLGLIPDPQNLDNPIYGWMTDNRITAFDPLFWGHHSNVDRIWARWQELHNGTPQEMNGAMAPWTLTVKDSMSIQKLGYTYMKDSVFFKVSNEVGLMKFNSESTNVSQNTLDTHRKAEIILHRIQLGNLQNANIRVFLNTPNADINTPTINNDNFVEQITTFNSSCYGGPGHCNLPLDKTRTFDLRTLNHHEPRNYKIDATAAVKRVLNNGDKNITIQLVIVGINGKQIENAVYINGISLNFID